MQLHITYSIWTETDRSQLDCDTADRQALVSWETAQVQECCPGKCIDPQPSCTTNHTHTPHTHRM